MCLPSCLMGADQQQQLHMWLLLALGLGVLLGKLLPDVPEVGRLLY